MKVYHRGSKRSSLDDIQLIIVAPDDSKGVNNIDEWYAQITVRKKQKIGEVLTPKDWSVRQFKERNEF